MIDSTSIKQIDYKKSTSYSFFIKRKRKSSKFFENLVIKIDSLENTSAYILKYTYNSKPVYYAAHDSYSFDSKVEVIPIDLKRVEGLYSKMQYSCINVYQAQCNNLDEEGTWSCNGPWHVAGPNCNNCVQLKQIGGGCGYYDDGSDNSGTTSGGTTTSGGGAGGSSDPNNNDPNQIVSIPNDCKYCDDELDEFVDDDVTNGIILDSSLPDCLESMIMNLMLGVFPYSQIAPKTELISEVFQTLGSGNPEGIDLVTTYKMGNIGAKNGETSTAILNPITNKYEISITISESLMINGTKLAIAKTVLHESIHAYLEYIAKQYPSVFVNTNGDFSKLVAAWQVYNNKNYAQHIYMANLIEDIATNIGNFVSEQYGYPSPFSSGLVLSHYEAVSWSGIALLSDPTNVLPYIENPIFIENYPDLNDRITIVNIFNNENDTTLSNGSLPLINNKCN